LEGNDNPNHAVVVFIFDAKHDKVLLIKKARPEWQKGLYNGVGGRAKFGESSEEAAIREVKEETGFDICKLDLHPVIHMLASTGMDVDFFSCKVPEIYRFNDNNDEPLDVFWISKLPDKIIPNLRWLIPLAYDDTTIKPLQICMEATHG